MANYRFEYDIEGVEKTMTAIRRGIREGMEESADDLIDRGERAAKDRIYESRRVWTREVYKYGWSEQDVDTLSPTRVTGRVTNYSEHAYVVDEGYKPQWGQPPVQNIIEWVDAKVQGGWTLSDEDGGSGDPPTTELDTSSVARSDATIKEVITGADEGVSNSANARDIRVVEYEDGDRGLFKPNTLGENGPGLSSTKGVVENEAVVSRAADLMGWTNDGGFPISRQRTITDVDGTEVTGNIMAFVEDAEEIGDRVKNYYKPEANISPEEFAERNMDWAARAGVIDYIVNNDDRHTGNILLDPDNRPWAIDSGGHHAPDMEFESQRSSRLLVFNEWENLDRDIPGHGHAVEDPQRMHAVSNAILDRQEEIFEELRDIETREEFIEFAEGLHPDDSLWSGHYEDMLSPDSTKYFRLYDNEDEWGGEEIWENDIQKVRDWLDDTLDARQPDEPATGPGDGVPWQQEEPDDWYSLTTEEASLNEMMDELFGELDDS